MSGTADPNPTELDPEPDPGIIHVLGFSSATGYGEPSPPAVTDPLLRLAFGLPPLSTTKDRVKDSLTCVALNIIAALGFTVAVAIVAILVSLAGK